MGKLTDRAVKSAIGLVSLIGISGCGAVIAGRAAQMGYTPGVIFGQGLTQFEAANAARSQTNVNVYNSGQVQQGPQIFIDKYYGKVYYDSDGRLHDAASGKIIIPNSDYYK